MRVSFHLVQAKETFLDDLSLFSGLQSIWGLGTPLRRITPHCHPFTQLPKPQRKQKKKKARLLSHDKIRISFVEGEGTKRLCLIRYTGVEAALSIWWEEGGREQTGPCLRARLGEGESSAVLWDGIASPSVFVPHGPVLLNASCLATALSAYLSDWQPFWSLTIYVKGKMCPHL